jgi:penicillin amidase
VPGWDRQHEWTGTLSFDDLPEIVNPEEGILATANSEPDVPCPHFLTRDFMDDGRKRRIMQLLRSRDRHSLDDMQSMHMDLVSLPARAIAAQLCRALDSAANPELTYLAGWDGSLDAASVPATIYEVFREQLRRRVFRDLPLSIHALLHGQGTHEPLGYLGSVFHSQATSLVVRLVNELLATESGTAIVSEAFRATIAWLRARLGPDPARWQWGRLHRIGFTHVLGRGVPLLDRLLRLSRGPFPAGGDGDTIAHCGVDPWHPFDGGMFSVSYRQLFDLGDWDAARFILPTGQSGHPGSPHYDDMVKAWLRGEYRPLLFSGEAIDRASVGTISIGPSSASHSRSSHLTAPGSPGEK